MEVNTRYKQLYVAKSVGLHVYQVCSIEKKHVASKSDYIY
jgi:hypothetical protein